MSSRQQVPCRMRRLFDQRTCDSVPAGMEFHRQSAFFQCLGAVGVNLKKSRNAVAFVVWRESGAMESMVIPEADGIPGLGWDFARHT
jgi:hypothetical protein